MKVKRWFAMVAALVVTAGLVAGCVTGGLSSGQQLDYIEGDIEALETLVSLFEDEDANRYVALFKAAFSVIAPRVAARLEAMPVESMSAGQADRVHDLARRMATIDRVYTVVYLAPGVWVEQPVPEPVITISGLPEGLAVSSGPSLAFGL